MYYIEATYTVKQDATFVSCMFEILIEVTKNCMNIFVQLLTGENAICIVYDQDMKLTTAKCKNAGRFSLWWLNVGKLCVWHDIAI